MVVVLVVILLVLVVVGWALRPQSTGFPNVPENVSLTAEATGVTAIAETLTRTPHNGATLVLSVSDGAAAPTDPWILAVGNLGGGRICTPKGAVPQPGGGAEFYEPLQPYHISRPPKVSIGGPPVTFTDVNGRGNFYVELCWSSQAPVNLNRSYLSAQFPPILVSPLPNGGVPADGIPSSLASVQLTRMLVPRAGDVADYVIQSLTAATSADADSWTWDDTVTANSIRLSAVNVSGTQHDNYLAFLSGITLGIAGGALIAILQEFVAPLSRRRDARHPI
jgi:hypothetical protein